MPSLIVLEIYHSAHLLCGGVWKGLTPLCVRSNPSWNTNVIYFLRLSGCQQIEVMLSDQQLRASPLCGATQNPGKIWLVGRGVVRQN